MKKLIKKLPLIGQLWRMMYYICHYRYFYSLYFCYKYLPREQAVKLPILFCKGGYAEIENDGKIILENSFFSKDSNKIYIGEETKDFDYQCERTYLHIAGELRIKGTLAIRRGVMIEVCGKAIFGNDIVFGSRTRLRVHNSIEIGDYVRIAHESQIFDTNFHFSEDVTKPGYYPISKPIKIGSFCWIGNRSTISKGTVLPDYSTVASNSLITKDYSDIPPYTLLGGTPAKILRNNFSRVFDTKREFEYQCREFVWYRNKYKNYTPVKDVEK